MSDERKTENEFVKSCGNVFTDLGLENPNELLAKVELMLAVRQQIKQKKLTQAAVAVVLGMDKSEVSRLVNGKISDFTYERLLQFLNTLNMNVRITIEPTLGDERGTTLVTMS